MGPSSKSLRIVYRVAIRNQSAWHVAHASVHTRCANPARLMQARSRRLQEKYCTSHERVKIDKESPVSSFPVRTRKKVLACTCSRGISERAPFAVEEKRGLHRTALSQLFPERCRERTRIPKSVVVYQPLPKLKNANDSDIAPALEVRDPLRTAFDTGQPTRAGLEASSNLQQPRLSWYSTTIAVC
jgi:hypothetical protein